MPFFGLGFGGIGSGAGFVCIILQIQKQQKVVDATQQQPNKSLENQKKSTGRFRTTTSSFYASRPFLPVALSLVNDKVRVYSEVPALISFPSQSSQRQGT